MATPMAKRTTGGQLQNRAVSSAVPRESTCTRCGGLMVSDYCMDLLNSTGELEFAAKRCVQCGEVVDPVIQRNRRLREEQIPVRLAKMISSINCVTEGPA